MGTWSINSIHHRDMNIIQHVTILTFPETFKYQLLFRWIIIKISSIRHHIIFQLISQWAISVYLLHAQSRGLFMLNQIAVSITHVMAPHAIAD